MNIKKVLSMMNVNKNNIIKKIIIDYYWRKIVKNIFFNLKIFFYRWKKFWILENKIIFEKEINIIIIKVL